MWQAPSNSQNGEQESDEMFTTWVIWKTILLYSDRNKEDWEEREESHIWIYAWYAIETLDWCTKLRWRWIVEKTGYTGKDCRFSY